MTSMTPIDQIIGLPFDSIDFSMCVPSSPYFHTQPATIGLDEWENEEVDGDKETTVEIDSDLEDNEESASNDTHDGDEDDSDKDDDDEFEQYLFGEDND
ncbi:MAG: hypothetical protein HOC27_08585 [Phycisphaerae bacterium]|nr:hypothetical protein [Phycisphaerae bacterium]